MRADLAARIEVAPYCIRYPLHRLCFWYGRITYACTAAVLGPRHGGA
jgi:hypothetical protein